METTISSIKPALEEPTIAAERPLFGKFAVQRVKEGRSASGERFIVLKCSDNTGSINVYSRTSDWPSVPGRKIEYRDVAFTLVPDRYECLQPVARPARDIVVPSRSPLELVPTEQIPRPNDLERLQWLLHNLQIPAYQAFADACFADAELTWLFATIPASRDCHHIEPGGLLRHSVTVAESVQQAAQRIVDSTIMQEAATLVGLFHDIGKVLIASSRGSLLPYRARQHQSLLLYGVQQALYPLRNSNPDAHDAFWIIANAYEHKSTYDVPLAGLVQAMDQVSAQEAAIRVRHNATRGNARTKRHWIPLSTTQQIWRPVTQ